MTAPVATNEVARLAALRAYGILDTPPEPVFDDLVQLAADLCATPVAQLNFVDETRVWTKAFLGASASGLARDVAFCGHSILRAGPMVVPDARADARFASSPLVLGEPHIRFYAAAPLLTPDGLPVGTFCVADYIARTPGSAQVDALARLSRQAMAQLDLRRSAQVARDDLRAAEEALRASRRRQAAVAGLGGQALEGLAFQALLETAVAAVAGALEAQLVSVWELLPGGARLRLRAAHGFRPDLAGVAEVSAGARESQAGFTLASGGPVVVPDVPGETRFTPPPVLVEHGAASGLSVVIGPQAGPWGVLAAHTARRRDVGEEEVHFLQAIANVLAGAVERGRADLVRRGEGRFRPTPC